ncbi:hypothetical protein V6N11_055983 [Hibiscus sabdariffa]|uniref:Uncharacterized protein n=1 Tax=Hibiscus sabdariffa TaxID=183260 RepID=A0ABR2T2H0_9ROSI
MRSISLSPSPVIIRFPICLEKKRSSIQQLHLGMQSDIDARKGLDRGVMQASKYAKENCAKLRLSCSEGFRFFPLTDLIAGGTSHPLLAALTIYTLPCLELSRLAQPPALIITIPLLMLFVSSRLVSLTSRTVIKLNYLTSRMTARTTMLFVCNENS